MIVFFCMISGMALTRFGAAHPKAADSAVITPRAPMAPAKTYMRIRERDGEREGKRTVRARFRLVGHSGVSRSPFFTGTQP